MSDEFFDRYNAMNEPEPASGGPEDTAGVDESAPVTADAANDADHTSAPMSYDTPADNFAPAESAPVTGYEQPAPQPEPQPAAPNYWQNPYSNTAQSAHGQPYPYSSGPVQNAPGYSQPSATYVSTPPAQNPANTYVDENGYYHRSFTEHRATPQNNVPQRPAPQRAPKHEKRSKGGMSKGAIAIVLILCVLLSGAAGFAGSYIYAKTSGSSNNSSGSYNSVSDELVIHKVSVENSTEIAGTLVDKSTDDIVDDVADSVVEITTEVVQTNSFYGQYIAQGAGSGVIISEDGYIVTNNHVIEDASSITVTLRSGESYDAELIGTDADEDIALLKINATGMTMAIFGDSDTLEVGDKSVIIGNPLGTLGGSVTEGIVSALDRSIVIDGKTMHLMQTDAAINPGNSGGGMFNGQGELVGIVVAKSGGSTSSGSTIDNIGFVIPINNVLNILGDLKQYGYVRGKADTGMSFVDITNQMYAWYYYNSTSTGVYISSVERGSAAAEAGFSAGDRVISVDGKTVSSASDITSIIAEHSAGDTITFELERNGRTGTIDLTLDEYNPNKTSYSSFGSYY